jgi:hypothetical protein
VGQLGDAPEVSPVDGGDHDLADPGGARALDDSVAIRVEFRRVEMAMRVDPHDTMMPLRADRPTL